MADYPGSGGYEGDPYQNGGDEDVYYAQAQRPPAPAPPPQGSKPSRFRAVGRAVQYAQSTSPMYKWNYAAEPVARPASERDVDELDGSCLGRADCFNVCPKKRSLEDGSLVNRMLVCAVAVAFLWASSLAVCRAIVDSIIDSPDNSRVYDVCENAYDVVVAEAESYDTCAVTLLNQCNRDFDSNYQVQAESVNDASIANSLLVERVRSDQVACAAAYSNMYASLREFQDPLQGVFQNLTYVTAASSECSSRDLTNAQNLVGSSGGLRSNTFQSARTFSDSSTSTSSSLARYSSDLSAYNVEYISNKTSFVNDLVDFELNLALSPFALDIGSVVLPDTNFVLGCATLSENNTCPFIETTGKIVGDSLNSLESSLSFADRQFDRLKNESERYFDDASSALASAVAFWDAVNSFIGGLDAAVCPGFVDGCSITNLFGDFPRTDFVVGPMDLSISIGAFPAIPPLSDAFPAALVADYLANVSLSQLDIQGIGPLMLQNVTLGLMNINFFELDDYNPPEVRSASATYPPCSAPRRRSCPARGGA